MNNALKRELAYSLMSVASMVSIMLAYNIILEIGFNRLALAEAARQFIPLVIIAFVVQKFVVSHNVFALYKKLVSQNDSLLKRNVVMALLWVTFMYLIMSLYSTLVTFGTENDFWRHWLIAVARNYPIALIAQGLLVGPTVRWIHARIFPPMAYAA